MNTTLKQAVNLIARRKDFKGNSLYAKTISNFYIVYSYGQHFPIAVYNLDSSMWYINTDKYSITTSRHQSIVRQALIGETVEQCTTEYLKNLLRGN